MFFRIWVGDKSSIEADGESKANASAESSARPRDIGIQSGG